MKVDKKSLVSFFSCLFSMLLASNCCNPGKFVKKKKNLSECLDHYLNLFFKILLTKKFIYKT